MKLSQGKGYEKSSWSIAEGTRERERERVKIPILAKLSETYTEWQNMFQVMPRVSRYTLGSKIDELFLELLQIILFASYTKGKEKLAAVTKASIKLDAIKFFLQLGWQSKLLQNMGYVKISESLHEVGRMLGGWIKSLQDTKEGR